MGHIDLGHKEGFTDIPTPDGQRLILNSTSEFQPWVLEMKPNVPDECSLLQQAISLNHFKHRNMLGLALPYH